MDLAGFDWDSGNWPKCGKHGVSKAEIEFVLQNDPRVAPDIKNTDREERYIAVGRNATGRPMFIGFTFRDIAGVHYVRPITARYMHDREAQRYAAQSAENDD